MKFTQFNLRILFTAHDSDKKFSLKSLDRLDYPKRLHVLVVESTDSLRVGTLLLYSTDSLAI